jgi:hypothetical protein
MPRPSYLRIVLVVSGFVAAGWYCTAAERKNGPAVRIASDGSDFDYWHDLTRTDEPRAEEIQDQVHGLPVLPGRLAPAGSGGLRPAAQETPMEMVEIHLNNGTLYRVKHAVVKSIGGRAFMTGDVLLIRDSTSQRGPDAPCRAWVPVDQISVMLEYLGNPANPPAANLPPPPRTQE